MASLAAALALAGCGGSISLAWGPDSGGGAGPVSVAIDQPTTSTVYATNLASVALAGSFSDAAVVWVRNTATGTTLAARLERQGATGRWSSDPLALVAGDNLILVTADYDGSGRSTATDSLTVRRGSP